MAKAKFSVMSLTQAAADRVQELVAGAERPVVGIKVGVKNGGCAGMSYTMDFVEAIGPREDVVEDKGVKIIVDPKALLFLLGTEMDIETTKFSSGFTFRNPNQTSACGCGESVAITPVSMDALQKATA